MSDSDVPSPQGGAPHKDQVSQVEIAQKSARATLLLLIGNVLSTIVLAVAAIVIARLQGPDLYGVYSLALVVLSIFLYFAGLGANMVVTRYSAYYLPREEVEKARTTTEVAIGFLALTWYSQTKGCFAAKDWRRMSAIREHGQNSGFFPLVPTLDSAQASSRSEAYKVLMSRRPYR